jgi:hypothetical protein
VHESLIEAARRVTVPVQFLLPWDMTGIGGRLRAGRRYRCRISSFVGSDMDAAAPRGRSGAYRVVTIVIQPTCAFGSG